MRKKRFSLSVQILGLCLGLVLVISATVTAIFYVNINRITEDNIREKSKLTMQFINANLAGSLAPFICNKGTNSLTSNSDAVVMIAENTKSAVQQLEKSINSFKIREE
jgi:sensor histidine kinase regulating citrate/malate metabolism